MTKVNQAAIDLIKEFEGLRLLAYQDSVGVWTIGYGTTAAAGVGITPKMGMRITQAQAEEYLRLAVEKFADKIRPAVTMPVTENEFGAMVSLAYNIGPGAFTGSTLLRRFNSGDTKAAADQFLVWNKAGGKVLAGLTRRRQAERTLFLTVKAVSPTSELQSLLGVTADGIWGPRSQAALDAFKKKADRVYSLEKEI